MITCPNCGAQIEESADKCPYCGYINVTGAEQKYMDNLEQVREQLDVIDDEVAASFASEVNEGIRVIIKTLKVVGVIALIIASLVGAGKVLEAQMDRSTSNSQSLSDIGTAREIYKELDGYYKAGDYETLDKVFNDYGGYMKLWEYEHATFINGYDHYVYLRDKLLPVFDSGDKIYEFEQEYLTIYGLYFYYRVYDVSEVPYGDRMTDEEIKVMDDIRDNYMLDIVYNRMGYTDEELASLRGKMIAKDYYDHAAVKKATKQNFARYK